MTLYLTDGAIAGRLLRVTETEFVTRVDRQVPRGERLDFSIHLEDGVLCGQGTCLAQEGKHCRMQFAALTPRERERLEPWIDRRD